MSATRPYRSDPDGLILQVRLTPRSSRDAVDGIATLSDGSAVIVARVRALPEDGAANQALAGAIAKALRVPKSAVTIVGGAKNRLKRVRVEGGPAQLIEVIDRWPSVN